jgi:Abortive infection C-terminus
MHFRMADLDRPSCLADEQWAAIQSQLDRIDRARSSRDHAQVVGSAKELCESVAKVILETRGAPFGSNASVASLVNQAHSVIERQPGPDLADDVITRNIAQGAKSIGTQLGGLRNAFGTGHGQTRTPLTLEEHAVIAADAVLCGHDGAFADLIT